MYKTNVWSGETNVLTQTLTLGRVVSFRRRPLCSLNPYRCIGFGVFDLRERFVKDDLDSCFSKKLRTYII